MFFFMGSICLQESLFPTFPPIDLF
ncbi:unnamed protein product [Spirodela intermedia]|uniref:Uncharacterized protein n=1 Tax=Spirodela intermedia TaxID=51605 RepID=A0A7I8LKT8_SPIIN|nr:unnamed protein product [Spirodela intermedia]